MKQYVVKHLYLKTFFLAFAAAFVIFLPAMIYDKGYFLFVGDFNSQQVPFHMNLHDAIRNGEWGWNWYTDLGANLIGSYTFYILGSPFFWLTIPFPRAAVPYMLGPLLMLKFACAALFSCIYIRRYVKNELLAVLGALLYAFSGYSIYNIFFNHFHEAIVFFPLMLIALDEWMEKGTRGVFALAVALNALVNYFFFFGEVIFIIAYYFVKLFTGGYQRDLQKFWGIWIEAILGFLMSFVLMLPSALSIMQNSRVNNFASGFNLWIYYNRFRIYSIMNNLFFPPELPSKQVLIPEGNVKWSSLNAYMPLFSMTGVLVFLQTKRRDWLSVFIKVLLVMAAVPALNSLFVAMNASYYARWFYMLTLMLSLATVRALDQKNEVRFKRSTIIVFVFTTILFLILLLTPQFSKNELKRIGIYDEAQLGYFLGICLTAIVSLIILFFVIKGLRKNPEAVYRRAIVIVMIFAVLYGNFFIVWGKTRSYDTHNYLIPDAIEGESKITIPDKDEVIRIDVDDSLINMGMFWNISCMRAFHSIVPASIMDFYKYIGEKRDVSSKIPESQYAVRALVGVHWYFDRIGSSDDFGPIDGSGDTLMPGYSYYGDMAGYHVWENNYYIPIGFTYDKFILKSELDNIPDANKAAMMLHAICLSDETAYKFMDVVEHQDKPERYLCIPATYYADCEKHKLETVDNLQRTKKGVTCTTDFPGNRLVYFGIPYDDGWSCYVDGREVPIEKVNIGFMAIKVEAGEHQIEFIYRTPGLLPGIIITFIAVGLFVAYFCIFTRKDQLEKQKVRSEAREERIRQETISGYGEETAASLEELEVHVQEPENVYVQESETLHGQEPLKEEQPDEEAERTADPL